jgi:hypothetical protein
MRIKRLLDDREVLVGDRLFDALGRSYTFVEHSGGGLVVADAERLFRITSHEDMK